ncbi:MAG: hypothetical protein K2X27_02705, partial [Candidatus Obscuribacterales bacterium]|nr:hypothetical protein [Candidatus Obscuribacterales bacterium]
NQMGCCHCLLQRYAEGIPLLEQALSICTQSLPEHGELRERITCNLQSCRDKERAQPAIDEAWGIYSLSEEGRFQEAFETAERSLKAQRLNLGADHWTFGVILAQRAHALMGQENYREALRDYKVAASIISEWPDSCPGTPEELQRRIAQCRDLLGY